jgi:DNA-binding MarR family transcriptional regulator
MNKKQLQELSSLFFSMKQILRSQLPDAEVDPNAWLRYQTMRHIRDTKGPTMHDVAAYLRIKAPSATSLISYLAKAGLIVRKGEKADKRVVRIFLTARGKREVERYESRSSAMMHATFSRLDDRELRELVKILRHLQDAHSER